MILAIDGGLAKLGWAVVTPRTGRVVDLGVRITESNATLGKRIGKNEERLGRLEAHAAALREIAARWSCTSVEAEAISLPQAGGISSKAGAYLTWGMIVGLTCALGMPRPHGIAPAKWQRAVLPDDGERKHGGYAAIERALAAFVGEQGAGADALRTIARSHRNHALDACGVGVYAALRGDAAPASKRRKAAA